MRESIKDYPALQMEDDAFLASLKADFVELREELYEISEEMSFSECIETLIARNRVCVDKGSSLPIYIPVYADDGKMVGSRAVPVWSGVHVGFPLYPGLSKDAVEAFLYGNPRRFFSLGEDFLACDPAFKLALLVHYAFDNVIIHELAIESFLLGLYEEMPFSDDHYLQTGLPSTSLTSVSASTGLACKRLGTQDGGYCLAIGRPEIDGWTVRVRGSKPKEMVFRDCWQEMRARNTEANKPLYVVGGEKYSTAKMGKDGRARSRSGSAAVDFMVAWVDSLKVGEGFPMRGSRVNWKTVHRWFEERNPNYKYYWTADTMRRTYKRRKSRG